MNNTCKQNILKSCCPLSKESRSANIQYLGKLNQFKYTRCFEKAQFTLQAAAAIDIQKEMKQLGQSQTGHSILLHGFGEIGEVPAQHLPWLLRIAHIRSKEEMGDSQQTLREGAIGVMVWKHALEMGLLPDNGTISQMNADENSIFGKQEFEDLQWPSDTLRKVLIRRLTDLQVAYFAKKYPSISNSLVRNLLETILKYYKTLYGITEEEAKKEVDAQGQQILSAQELFDRQEKQRAIRQGQKYKEKEVVKKEMTEDELDRFTEQQNWSPERKLAEAVVGKLVSQWRKPIQTLQRAGRAFGGLEQLLAGAAFDSNNMIWQRKGWDQMDGLRKKLEDLKELRDLVRSLGRGGGWGPLRRSPVQFYDPRGRDGLLRTVLEVQETRGLTRSDDISRLLPSEAALLARGRSVRWSKLLFFAKMAEKALQIYERDGWGQYTTNIIPERREIRPTADRGPILLCCDTSGSMRGERETVAKALALECMRAAREQERDCYVFAFSGPKEVSELELNNDMKSVNNLLEFLEKTFNGGSDFNEPVRRCMDRLTQSKWANSDILLVSDGELRQPGPEIMRKLTGAKDKLGLRVHGLIVGNPDEEKRRSDPAVLRSLCTNYLPNGKTELLVSKFEDWESVRRDDALQFDWDDLIGGAQRRAENLAHDEFRKKESRRLSALKRQQKTGKKSTRQKAKDPDAVIGGRRIEVKKTFD